jgi:hypothetical protein
MLTFFEILMAICQICGILLLLCVLFRGTRFVEKVQEWMKRHQKITTVFAVMAMIGLAISIARTIMD